MSSHYVIYYITLSAVTCVCLSASLEIRSRAGSIDRLHARRVAREEPDYNDDDEPINMEFGAPDEHQGDANHPSTTTESAFAGAEEARLEHREDDADSSTTTTPPPPPPPPPEHATDLQRQHTAGDEVSDTSLGQSAGPGHARADTVSEGEQVTSDDPSVLRTGEMLPGDDDDDDDDDAQIQPKDDIMESLETEAEDIQTRDEVAEYSPGQSAGHGHARAGGDPCDSVPCNYGICIVVPETVSRDGFTCMCYTGYTGTRCDVYHPEMFTVPSTTTGRPTTTRGWGPPPNARPPQDPPGYLRSDDAAVVRVSASLVAMATGLLLLIGRHL